jgi:hypothetical protein
MPCFKQSAGTPVRKTDTFDPEPQELLSGL